MTGIALIKQWHPAFVHYPIALLTVELFFLCLYVRTKKPNYELFCFWLLTLAAVSMIPVVLSGLNDSGLDMGPGLPLLLGFQDRLKNAFRLESTISLHVLMTVPVVLSTVVRCMWWWRMRRSAASVNSVQLGLHLVLAFVSLILMYAAAYIGGTVSH